MVRITRGLLLFTAYCLLWVLTRSLQFVFEVTKLQREADHISGSELELQIKIRNQLEVLLPWIDWWPEF